MFDTIDKLTQAKTRLSLKEPFFSTMLFRFPLKATEEVPLAAVTPRGVILYNPKAIDRLSVEEIVFLLCHEVMHVALSHAMRRGDRDHFIFNIACDAVINETLIELGIGQFLNNGVRMPGAQNRLAEDIYDEIFKKTKFITIDLDLIFSGDKTAPAFKGDTISGARRAYGEALDESETREIANRVKLAVAEGITKEKMSGMGNRRGAFLEKLGTWVLTEKLPWYQLLGRFMNKFVSQNESWRRPNKRFSDVYLPSVDKEARMGTLVVGIDTSGSIDSKTLGIFGKHLFDVIEECKPEEVIVLWCDAEIQKVERHDWEEVPFELEAPGRGGTDMTKITHWVADNAEEADACVILTDGYTPYPAPDDEKVPTLWVLTHENKRIPEHINYVIFETD